jgi:hypothetical protein
MEGVIKVSDFLKLSRNQKKKYHAQTSFHSPRSSSNFTEYLSLDQPSLLYSMLVSKQDEG